MAAGTARPAAVANTPETVTRDFYRWYLGELVKDGEPMTDQPARFARYTTADLRREIKRQMASPDGLDSDYFTGAQDFDDSWPANTAVVGTKITGATATTMVIIGNSVPAPIRARVTLRREVGGWKIARVTFAE